MSFRISANGFLERLYRFECFSRIAREFVEKKFTEMRSENTTKNRRSLLEQFISNADCDKKDILGMTVDILLAGIDTVST